MLHCDKWRILECSRNHTVWRCPSEPQNPLLFSEVIIVLQQSLLGTNTYFNYRFISGTSEKWLASAWATSLFLWHLCHQSECSPLCNCTMSMAWAPVAPRALWIGLCYFFNQRCQAIHTCFHGWHQCVKMLLPNPTIILAVSFFEFAFNRACVCFLHLAV